MHGNGGMNADVRVMGLLLHMYMHILGKDSFGCRQIVTHYKVAAVYTTITRQW